MQLPITKGLYAFGYVVIALLIVSVAVAIPALMYWFGQVPLLPFCLSPFPLTQPSFVFAQVDSLALLLEVGLVWFSFLGMAHHLWFQRSSFDQAAIMAVCSIASIASVALTVIALRLYDRKRPKIVPREDKSRDGELSKL